MANNVGLRPTFGEIWTNLFEAEAYVGAPRLDKLQADKKEQEAKVQAEVNEALKNLDKDFSYLEKYDPKDLTISDNVLAKLSVLPTIGVVKTNGGCLYAKIHEMFVEYLQPLMKSQGFDRPPYYAYGGIGAHISIIPTREFFIEFISDCSKIRPIQFKLQHIKIIESEFWTGIRKAAIIEVESPDIEAFRMEKGLSPEMPKGHRFHFTVGVVKTESASAPYKYPRFVDSPLNSDDEECDDRAFDCRIASLKRFQNERELKAIKSYSTTAGSAPSAAASAAAQNATTPSCITSKDTLPSSISTESMIFSMGSLFLNNPIRELPGSMVYCKINNKFKNPDVLPSGFELPPFYNETSDFFNPIGAHINVIADHEAQRRSIKIPDGLQCSFRISAIKVVAPIGWTFMRKKVQHIVKKSIVAEVQSEDLEKLRTVNGLEKLPEGRPFSITLGIQTNRTPIANAAFASAGVTQLELMKISRFLSDLERDPANQSDELRAKGSNKESDLKMKNLILFKL